jgi:hypothetical protein
MIQEPANRPSKAHWDRYYRTTKLDRIHMGRKDTYLKATEFLDEPGRVLEDWGGGTGKAGEFVKHANYRVVDGSPNRHADQVAELHRYRSSPDAILIRHVLEHNHTWRAILHNAVESFTWRFVLVLFTPLADHTHNTANPGKNLPYYRFKLDDLLAVINPLAVRIEPVGTETIFYIAR